MSEATTAVKARPIIMSAESVTAILAGAKTMTRRVVKPPPPPMVAETCSPHFDAHGEKWAWYGEDDAIRGDLFRCPYGRVGDRLWVNEKWRPYAVIGGPRRRGHSGIIYGDQTKREDVRAGRLWTMERANRWRSPLHMPRWASRLTLELTAIRVERVRTSVRRTRCLKGCERLRSVIGAGTASRKSGHAISTA